MKAEIDRAAQASLLPWFAQLAAAGRTGSRPTGRPSDLNRVILGTDHPAGSGVQPLDILRMVSMLSSVGDLPGIGMTIIDGNVRTTRSRNTPPASRVPEIVGH